MEFSFIHFLDITMKENSQLSQKYLVYLLVGVVVVLVEVDVDVDVEVEVLVDVEVAKIFCLL